MKPPTPPDERNLKLVWNSQYPPNHVNNGTIKFVCDAGNKWNKFESDFNKNEIKVQCMPDNKFETVTWPKCVDGKIDKIIFV